MNTTSSDLEIPQVTSQRLSLDFHHAFSTSNVDTLEAYPLTSSTPLTPRYKTFKKLEVVNSHRINTLTGLYNIISLTSVLLSTLIVILARTAFSRFEPQVPVLVDASTSEFKLIDVNYYQFPSAFIVLDTVFNYVFFTYALFLFSAYLFVLFRAGISKMLNEQVWVAMLLLGATLYLNPFAATVRLRENLFDITVPGPEDGFSYVDVFTCIRMLSFSTISLLYIWMSSHSYRILTKTISISDWTFYLPKIAVVLTYTIYKLVVLFVFRIAFSELPFASLVACFTLYGHLAVFPRIAVITVAVLTTMETAILLMVLIDIIKTFKLHLSVEYVQHRTKLLGYRFFLHQQTIFYLVYVCNYVLILFGLPYGPQILQFYLLSADGGEGRGSYFDVQYAPWGLHLSILAYITTEAYTNLPASFSMRDLKFWSAEISQPDEVEPQPIMYRTREPPSFSGNELDLNPNCFVMQTNIELFNLAWFVYYQGTPKEKKLNIDYQSLPMQISKSFFDQQTDTRAFISESVDRIIIAFKGTSSRQNFLTDLKVAHSPLSQIVRLTVAPSGEESEISTRVDSVITGKEFRRARVHAGFATAYNTIRPDLIVQVDALLKKKNRPIFLTGHSLGGALATISSIDISLSLDVPGTRILVSTFGSPRVGNQAFRNVYNAQVPMNWRLVAGGDIISRLPKVGYAHVGRRVVLTSAGDLFIDPNALDTMFWHTPQASFLHHRKWWYLLSLKSWCTRRIHDYSPNFWPFPVSASDNKRFEVSMKKPNSRTPSILSRRERKFNRVEKYQKAAEILDQLGATSIADKKSIENWGRLTMKLLTNSRNHPKPIIIRGRTSNSS